MYGTYTKLSRNSRDSEPTVAGGSMGGEGKAVTMRETRAGRGGEGDGGSERGKGKGERAARRARAARAGTRLENCLR